MSITHEDHCAGLSAVYAATAEDNVVSFAAPEKTMLYQALMEVIPRHRKKLRIFTPLSSLYSLCRDYRRPDTASRAFGCRGRSTSSLSTPPVVIPTRADTAAMKTWESSKSLM